MPKPKPASSKKSVLLTGKPAAPVSKVQEHVLKANNYRLGAPTVEPPDIGLGLEAELLAIANDANRYFRAEARRTGQSLTQGQMAKYIKHKHASGDPLYRFLDARPMTKNKIDTITKVCQRLQDESRGRPPNDDSGDENP
jgi:hypothetical protein